MARARSLRWFTCATLALVVGSAASVAHAQDCDGWVALHEIMPRKNPVMLATGPETAVLFGGNLGGQSPLAPDINTATSETWEFDGTRWRFVTLAGPTPRSLAAGAFDSARGRVVLFGGATVNPTNGFTVTAGDTWEFVGGQWIQRTTAHAPTARYGHAMAYDPSRGRTYLYGGLSISAGLFWAFDGEDWAEVPQPDINPGIQSNHRLVFDPRDNSILLVPYASTSPVWKWNGSIWSQMAPTQVNVGSAFFDAALDTIVLASHIGTFHTYAGAAAQQVVGLPPGSSGSNFPTAVPAAEGWLTVTSPQNSIPFAPTQYRVSPSLGWQPLATRPQPNAAQEMAFAYHAPTSEFVLFGGARVPNTTPVLAETWILRGESWREFTGAEPPARLSAQLAFSPQRGASLLLGGTPYVQTLWQWTGSGWTSTPTGNVTVTPGTPPTFDVSRDAIVWPVGAGVAVIDESVTSISVPNISTMNGATAFDPSRGMMFAGGQNSSATYRLVASGSGLSWQSVSLGSIMPGRWGPRMAFDPDRQGVVHFGGFTSGASNFDVSSFPRKTYFLGSAATAWTALPLQMNGPIGRKFQGMDYDPVARRVVMYGGLTHGTAAPLLETWKLARGPAAVALEPTDDYVVPGETGEAFIIASGGGVIEYQWYKDGEPLVNNARISGADTDTLQIRTFTSDDNAQYHVTVRNRCGEDESIAVQLRAIPTCPGDFDDSGTIDAMDLAGFFAAYERGLMIADVDLSGGIDTGDLAAFVQSFEAGGC